MINYFIKNEYHDDGVIIFTVPNQDIRTADKFYMNPHYVLLSEDKVILVLYSVDDDGGGSILLQHWFAFPQKIK